MAWLWLWLEVHAFRARRRRRAAAAEQHRPLDHPGPGDEPWHCQVCGGPCLEAHQWVAKGTPARVLHAASCSCWKAAA